MEEQNSNSNPDASDSTNQGDIKTETEISFKEESNEAMEILPQISEVLSLAETSPRFEIKPEKLPKFEQQSTLQSLESVQVEPKQRTLQSLESVKVEPNEVSIAPILQNGISEYSVATVKKEEEGFLLIRRKAFNNIEIRQKLSFQFSADVADYSVFYTKVVTTLEEALKKALVYANRGDKVQVELQNPDLKNNIGVILSDKSDLSSLTILLDRLGETNASVSVLDMVVQIVEIPCGGVKRALEKMLDYEILPKKRRFLHLVENRKDQLCFAISLAHCLNPEGTDHQATQLGAEMQRKVGLTDQIPVTFSDITKFEQLLNRKIVVFYREENSKTLSKFTTSFEQKGTKPLFLFLFQNHYYGIKNITRFLGYNFFCHYCLKSCLNANSHHCQNNCSICLDPGCVETKTKVLCYDCNKQCRSSYCFEAHKKKQWRAKGHISASECDRRKICPNCGFPIYISAGKTLNSHQCGSQTCNTCGAKIDNLEHKCYIQPLACVKNHSETNLVFYKFKTYEKECGEHVPFVLSTKTMNGKTWNSFGERCVVEFLLHFRSTVFNDAVFVAHNFNSSVLLNAMREIGVKPEVVMQNGKIVCIQDPDCRQKYIDSALFLPMPLSALPEAFGFSKFKEFFPIRFISEANLQYIGRCPAPEFYGVEEMNDKQRQEFETVYGLAKSSPFSFECEALLYCDGETNVLMTACAKLRQHFIEQYNVDPLSCSTPASFGMKVFCTRYLAPNTLALPLCDDYKPEAKPFTDASIEWLQWVMFSENIFVQHGLNKGVKQLDKFLVDGYSETDSKKCAWEFLTCFENGCPTCFPPAVGKTENDCLGRQKMCKERLYKLRALRGIKLIVIREHAWNQMKKSHVPIQEFLKHYKPPRPLTPHEALYKSRNCAIKLRYTAASDEQICFIKIVSLFPYVMMYGFYPIGHPETIHEKFANLQNYFGFVKAIVYPPRELYFPVLPYKMSNGKLVFTLCRTCAESNNQEGSCIHNEEERALSGVWVTPELNKALEIGYKVGKIIEVWHFKERSHTVFANHMKSFVKGMQESLGYPPEVTDQESQEKYVKEIQTKQGVTLDMDKIKSVPVNKQAYERCLEDFWQEFGDMSPQIQTEIVTKKEDLIKYMFSDEFNVEYFTFLNNQAALVQWTSKKKAKPLPKKTDNIFVTAFTTAYARLHLYNLLGILRERVLYCDTDQIIFVRKDGEMVLELGSCPGQLNDELAGDSIQEYVSSGPKSYAYQTKTNRVSLIVKGLTQTFENCEGINFDSVKDMVKGYIVSCENIESQTVNPQHGVVYDKRQLLPNGRTLPFGY